MYSASPIVETHMGLQTHRTWYTPAPASMGMGFGKYGCGWAKIYPRVTRDHHCGDIDRGEVMVMVAIHIIIIVGGSGVGGASGVVPVVATYIITIIGSGEAMRQWPYTSSLSLVVVRW